MASRRKPAKVAKVYWSRRPGLSAPDVSKVVLAWSLALTMAASFPGVGAAGTFTAFGPEDFVRQTGTPVTEARSFTVADPNLPYLLRIENGGADDGLGRVSSAVVTLNGVVVVAPEDFNQTVELIEKELVLAAENELAVEVRSVPGTGFTLTILGETLEIEISAPADGLVTQAGGVDVSGTVSGAASIEVNGVEAILEGDFGESTFLARDVPLVEGTNRIVATAQDASGGSASDTVTVRRDTDPPLVVIETPSDGDRLVTDVVTVAGTVNDIIPGATTNEDDVSVTVNGLPAAVNNRTFILPDLPLFDGPNTITAVAVDRAGNVGSASIVISREEDLAGIRILITGGNNQVGPISTSLPEPLAIRAVTDAGQPVAGRPVVFEVSRGDGLLQDPGDNLRRVTLLTDGNGDGAVDFKLGSRTGEGFHRVRVTTPGSLTFAEFCATALPTAPTTISVNRMPQVRGVVNQPLSDSLSVIVTDGGGNPVPGVDVTFRVDLGGGSFGGNDVVVATTNSDGLAEALWTLGPEPGKGNNEASADFAGNPGAPAIFLATAEITGPVEATRVSGVVQNSTGGPIDGARVVIRGTTIESFTTPDGRFVIHGVPPGGHRVAILGSEANNPAAGTFYPDIEFAIEVVPGADNELDQLVVLPFLNMAGAKLVGGDQDVVLEMDGVPGFAIKVFAHSVILPDGSRGEVLMSSSQVKLDKVPMPPPQGSTPLVVGTLQPAGIRFDPPARVVYPNVEGLSPGDVADIFAFHHDIGQFVNIGPGTVSADGSVVASDPGFGIVQSGWHCLIRLPGPAANCANNCRGRLEWREIRADGSQGPLKTSAPVKLFSAGGSGSKADITVNFSPGGGSFDSQSWSGGPPVVTRSNESASGTAAKVTVTASSDGSTTVTSPTYRIPVPDEADKTCEAQVEVEVKPIELKIAEVSFTDDHTIRKDVSGSAAAIADPVWKDVNTDGAPEKDEPVAYTRAKNMKVVAKFKITPALTSPVAGVTIKGTGPSALTFEATGVTLSGSEVTIPATVSSDKLPNQVKFFNPMTIAWEFSLDGTNFSTAGSSSHKVYVTLADPLGTINVFLTALHLAVSNDGATTQAAAAQKSWDLIKGPANIRSWDGRKLYYYKPGFGFSSCATTSEGLLTSPSGTGQCGSFARLLMDVYGINGITSNFTVVDAKTGEQFLVKNWTFGARSFPGTSHEWKLELSEGGFGMVPLPTGGVFGDMTSTAGLPGQNTPTPSEKAFARHFIVKTTVVSGDQFFDPSYGVTYSDADDFETKAVIAYYARFVGDPAGTYRVRKSAGLKNIQFTIVP